MATAPPPLSDAPKPTVAPKTVATGSGSLTLPTDAVFIKDITWVRTHILLCLLAVALIAGGIVGGVDLFENLIERHDTRIALAQQQREGVDTATQSTLLAQLAQDRNADAARDAAQTALITSLVAQMQQQHAATAKQVTTDSTLDTQSAASRLVTLTKSSPADAVATNDTVNMSLPLTRIVVADLDVLPQVQNDVTNLQGQLTAQQDLTTDAKTELGAANQVISADKTELIATLKADGAACDVRVDAQAKKDRKRGFWAVVAGFAGGVLLGSRF